MTKGRRQGKQMPVEEMIRQLRSIAQIGIVNAKKDTEILIRCADWMEEADERLAILTAELIDEDRKMSGLIEED